MAACIPSMGIGLHEPYRGTIRENKITENQAFVEFKYLTKTNYTVMQTQNHNIMTSI